MDDILNNLPRELCRGCGEQIRPRRINDKPARCPVCGGCPVCGNGKVKTREPKGPASDGLPVVVSVTVTGVFCKKCGGCWACCSCGSRMSRRRK